MSKMLQAVDNPEDLKKLNIEDLSVLASEIRDLIIDIVSKNGGHLGPNLGAVEFSIALHYVFDSPRDIMIYDVSHQSYTHKILTGRKDRFHTIRTAGGLSGFMNREESEYDSFGAGHACTALSAALGFAAARDLKGEDNKIIAVVGDGSLTGGMAWEALNQIGISGRDLLVLLNDNKMSISRNVGAIAKYLTDVLSDDPYNKLKNEIWKLTGLLPKYETLRKTVAAVEEALKGMMVPGVIFEKFGLRYFGPIDGHDIKLLVKTLSQVKKLPGPKILHILTVKGKGYKFAEEDTYRLHGVSKFDKMTGKSLSLRKSLPYTQVFGEIMTHLGGINDKICVITAAMSSGTGLSEFAEKYPDRFFDVGIAEQHAVTFAGGLAARGLKPYFAVYSSFLQRGFDQVLHDVALQNLPVVFCLDRAGLVGDDGPTHHGSFDISYLRAIPNVVIVAPRDGRELRDSLFWASTYDDGPVVIRYPRASVPEENVDLGFRSFKTGSWEIVRDGAETAILAVGSMVYSAWKAADILDKDRINCRVINCRFVSPMDEGILVETLGKFENIVTVCENSIKGGFGEGVIRWASERGYKNNFKTLGIPDKFIEHGNRDLLLRNLKLDPEGIAVSILEMIQIGKTKTGARKQD
ncbi:MAG: 1-deoxy-D-xylulose-5-phosphate synthase [Candidatus Zixiibacteriota bacterium]|nr:MAG: 1-deoxy-D-xylulose-5-phosphate synthase [candidate division Zixibacteria bacterium]